MRSRPTTSTRSSSAPGWRASTCSTACEGSGSRCEVFEAADSVGGTWYWNRYPGARCDVPSLEYSYGFSSELQQEWEWTEIMPSQPEVLKYLNHVADRFDLRRDIRFETRVTAAAFDEATSRWLVETDSGQSFSAKYCIMATGCLSAPLTPGINGMDTFDGPVHFTNSWPKEGVQLAGKRAGIVGTGSSGVQSIPVIAEEAGHLFVFQRTATYSFPAQNAPLDLERQRQTKEALRRDPRDAAAVFVGISGLGMPGLAHPPPTKSILEASEEERKEALDRYGFRVIRAFSDVGTNLEANEAACELYREQIRRVIDDPAVAERLSQRGYPVGCATPGISGRTWPGKPRIFMPYIGGVGNYRQKCDEIVAKGYEGFALTA